MEHFNVIKTVSEQKLIFKFIDFLIITSFLKENKIIKKNGKFPLTNMRASSRSGYSYYLTLALKKYIAHTTGIIPNKERGIDSYDVILPNMNVVFDSSRPFMQALSLRRIENGLSNATPHHRQTFDIKIEGHDHNVRVMEGVLRFNYWTQGKDFISFIDDFSRTSKRVSIDAPLNSSLKGLLGILYCEEIITEKTGGAVAQEIINMTTPCAEIPIQTANNTTYTCEGLNADALGTAVERIERTEVVEVDILDLPENHSRVSAMREMGTVSDEQMRDYLRAFF